MLQIISDIFSLFFNFVIHEIYSVEKNIVESYVDFYFHSQPTTVLVNATYLHCVRRSSWSATTLDTLMQRYPASEYIFGWKKSFPARLRPSWSIRTVHAALVEVVEVRYVLRKRFLYERRVRVAINTTDQAIDEG